MMRKILISSLSFTALAIASAGANALDLTAAGTADGFTLSEFVSGFANNDVGPLGMAVNSDGNVIVNDNSEVGGLNYVFKDVDGQTVAAALGTAPNPGFPPAYAFRTGRSGAALGLVPPADIRPTRWSNSTTMEPSIRYTPKGFVRLCSQSHRDR